jgi:hypothetical protein
MKMIDIARLVAAEILFSISPEPTPTCVNEEDRPVRDPTVLALPRFEIGRLELGIHVRHRLPRYIHDDRGPVEHRERNLIDPPLPSGEMSRRVDMRAAVPGVTPR